MLLLLLVHRLLEISFNLASCVKSYSTLSFDSDRSGGGTRGRFLKGHREQFWRKWFDVFAASIQGLY